MRSVFLYLRDTTENDVGAFLQHTYPFQQGPPWIDDLDGEPCLYIDFYHDASQEFEPEDWASLAKALGCTPTVIVVADVSGRYPGDAQVQSFIVTMLNKFQGLAQDDYTDHCWNAQEVRSGFRVRGHPFFDYRGWFEE